MTKRKKIDIDVSPERIEAATEEARAEVDEGAPESVETANALADEAIAEAKTLRRVAALSAR